MIPFLDSALKLIFVIALSPTSIFCFRNSPSMANNASVQDCEHGTAHAQASRSNTFKIKGKGNTADSRKETLTELMSQSHKKTKK